MLLKVLGVGQVTCFQQFTCCHHRRGVLTDSGGKLVSCHLKRLIRATCQYFVPISGHKNRVLPLG